MESQARPTGRDVDLLEYERLKDEQLGRINVRDNLVYATLAASGGVIAIAFGGGTPRFPLLLLLPPACLVLGWTYLVNDQKVSAIGEYIRHELSPRLSAAAGHELLRWESEHRRDADRTRRKITQVIVDVLLFCGSGVGGLGVFWALSPRIPWPLLTLSLVEIGALLLLAVEIIRCVDASRPAEVT
ncbi:hypothetical protein [Parafrankia sp. FMc2]|uniref:hypothetical protein n=1 Tax=Parafrankia sp. FMc2 TaxID=3233196 RepID=UPI0034D7539E